MDTSTAGSNHKSKPGKHHPSHAEFRIRSFILLQNLTSTFKLQVNSPLRKNPKWCEDVIKGQQGHLVEDLFFHVLSLVADMQARST